jgi:hypothetical protein
MKPEFPRIDRDKMVSPHAQEVEYALILSRMISTVKEDPVQMRLTVYEFARARLKIDMSWADSAERKRLSDALETAIQGVEQFSARRDEKERLQPPAAAAQIAPANPISKSMVEIPRVNSAPKSNLASREYYLRHEVQPVVEVQTRLPLSTLVRMSIGMSLFGVVVGLAVYKQRTAFLLDVPWELRSSITSMTAKPAGSPSIPDSPQQTSVAADLKTAAASSGSLLFPLPSDYGVYAVSNAALSELYLLPEQVPDKRVAMSTPVTQPSRTILPDGKN